MKSKMIIVEQIVAKKKTEMVIKSCKSNDHFEIAERMVELYHKKFEDFLGYNQLKRLIKKIKN